ncbi:MAG: ribosome silencing factor [Treponema sp.]|jgi:ribosome-associated protein|nr:ribosome silencing factor [Treponema sp.]
MGDMLQVDKADAIGRLLTDHKAGEVTILDLRTQNAFTDFFVIGTVSSSTHADALERTVYDFARENGLDITRKIRPRTFGMPDLLNEWRLIDMGDIVVHIMSEKARSFYELERLWS